MAIMQDSWFNKIYRETILPDSQVHERRSQQRIRISTPATVTDGQHTIAASVKEISSGGFFCVTDARFELGCDIAIVLVLPEGVGLPLTGMVCCHGRVVRVNFGWGQYGIAAQIERIRDASNVRSADYVTDACFWFTSKSRIE
jgi:Tfp pilus assembly protein PilZ